MFKYANILKVSFTVLIAILSLSSAQAQSSVQVNTLNSKTTISVANFPKNTTILIVDEDFNLLSTVSTSNSGTAVINLNKCVKSTITARTLHGGYEASFKPVKENEEDKVAITEPAHGEKA